MAQPMRLRTSISKDISKVVLGGAAWSHQINPDADTRPVIPVILKAFELGIRTIDTSPYYEPSEKILGKALSDPEITSRYNRQDYMLMTKVGRVRALDFDYSPTWVRKSVLRSLERFQTSYLDVVFCHDIEYVTDEDAVTAIGVLWEFVATGQIRYVGISGYPVDKLVRVAELARRRHGRPLDVVQNWGQLNVQNTRLRDQGLGSLAAAGVECVAVSSPLNIGLLTPKGPPQGKLGDWHPAPPAMRAAVARAAAFVAENGDDLASVALRFAFRETARTGAGIPVMATIIGPGSVEEVEGCARAAMSVRKISETGGVYGDLRDVPVLDEDVLLNDKPLVEGVRRELGEWIDYCFVSPPTGWDVKTKKVVEGTAEVVKTS